jgi:multidrug resistance efflux pump
MQNIVYESFKILIAFSVVFIIGCGNSREIILPSKTSITESVYSSVTIQPDSLYNAYAAVGGILENNLVEEGAKVFKGSPVAQIINNTPKLNTENARLNLELARKNYMGSNAVLKGLLEQINAAELQYKNDSINYFRQKNLWDQNIGSRVEYDTRKLAFELSRNNLTLLRSNYEQTKNELDTKFRQAQNNYKTSLIATNDFMVESKINGTVYALYKNPGETVNTMEPVASIGSSTDFLIEMLVDEVDIVKIRLGQKALITLDAYNSMVYEAVISKIYPKKDERSQTFKIEAVFTNLPETLYPGLSGEGNIIIAKKEDAMIIPKEYLIDENKVETEDGLVEVTLGLQNLENIEVLSGLDANTYIIKPGE